MFFEQSNLTEQADLVIEGDKIIYPNGDSYQGEIKDSKPHGQGKMIYYSSPDQLKKKDKTKREYDGNWMRGKRHGHGTLHVYLDSEGETLDYSFEGSFSHDLIHGKGVATFGDGRRMTGTWTRGLMNGEGSLEYPDGRFYEGAFESGLRHGKG